ncbi:hypothetical protein BKA83DRAFT_4127267 [Pisolithus microcarpus]|nr:hypothetical protein BKA83DRAFT_4127267 [Pisolithus microcarpus]
MRRIMGRFDARDGDRKSDVSMGDRSPPMRPTISQLNTGVGDRKSDISMGDRSLPMRLTVGQPNTGDGDRKSNVSMGNRSPPTRLTISQLNTGYDDRKTSISMGNKSPPMWQMAGQLEQSALGKSVKSCHDTHLECLSLCLPPHKISFKCPACHEKEEHAAHAKPMLYFMGLVQYSMLLLMHVKAFTQIMQGKSVPACSMATFVKGICKRASKLQVCGGPILILHFICMGLNTRGGIPRLLNAALEEYYMEATLWYLEVIFDFGTQHKLHHWQAEAQCLASTIGEDTFQQKIFFISVHSEVTHGDLFVGKDEGGDDVAVLPKEFMDYLFAGCLWPLVSRATLFMLSCGPVVTFPQSICSFKEALLELRPAYTIAFGATRFIGAVIKSFIVTFGSRVVIQGHDLGEVFTDLLNCCPYQGYTLFMVSHPLPPMGVPPPNELPEVQLYPLMVTIQARRR